MSATDKQLTGSNFCNLDCTDNNKIIHPESCTENVKITHDSDISLDTWFKLNANGGFGDYSNMLEWLQDNFTVSSSYSLPIASTSTLGGIKLNNTYFSINNTGVFSLKDITMYFTTNADYSNYINVGSLSNVFSSNSVNIFVPPFTTDLELNNNELSAKSYVDNVLYKTSKITLDNLATVIANNDNLKNSFNNRWQISITDNIIKLTDNVAQTSTQATLPYTNYTAGSNIYINNGIISATDTTYEEFSGTNAGLVPSSTTEITDRYLRSDGTWADPKYNSKKLWTSNGLSDHYFRITRDLLNNIPESGAKYVPLFKIHLNYIQSDSSYKTSHLFEITSRLDYMYYGKYLLTFYSRNSVQGLLPIQVTQNSILDIVAYYDSTNSDIIVYKKYSSMSVPDTFIVSILGQNNPDFSEVQNTYVYYCTASYENDTIIGFNDIVAEPTGNAIPLITTINN